jgi:hypothetical protein
MYVLITLETLVREYLLFVVISAGALYYLWTRFQQYLEDRKAVPPPPAEVQQQQRIEAMRAARERQQAYVTELSKQDEEVRKIKQAKELEERFQRAEALRRENEATAQQGGAPLGRLPKLPGGSRDTFRPSYTGSDRPSRYTPSAPGGGKKGG